jgi:hypothetical protein
MSDETRPSKAQIDAAREAEPVFERWSDQEVGEWLAWRDSQPQVERPINPDQLNDTQLAVLASCETAEEIAAVEERIRRGLPLSKAPISRVEQP